MQVFEQFCGFFPIFIFFFEFVFQRNFLVLVKLLEVFRGFLLVFMSLEILFTFLLLHREFLLKGGDFVFKSFVFFICFFYARHIRELLQAKLLVCTIFNHQGGDLFQESISFADALNSLFVAQREYFITKCPDFVGNLFIIEEGTQIITRRNISV